MDISNCTCGINEMNLNCSTYCTRPAIYSREYIFVLHLLYIIISFTGVIGNLSTCAVIALRKSMRRSIHFYTCNLAVCDLLILFFYVPTQMILLKDQLFWRMGEPMCKVANVVLPVSLFSTVGTLLAITFDRARGLLQPFKYRSDSKRMARIIIPMIWIVSFVVSSPLFVVTKVRFSQCGEDWPNGAAGGYWISMFAIFFVTPLVVIIAAHAVMLYAMTRDNSSAHRKHNKRMIRMVTVLVIVFTVCTGSQHVNYFLSVERVLSWHQLDLIYGISNFVVALQAALNPVIYGTLRQDFNKAFRNIIVKLMVKLKLHKEEGKFEFHRKLLLPFVSFNANSNTDIQKTMDSPLASERNSFMFQEPESKLPPVQQTSRLGDKVVMSTLHNNLLEKYTNSSSSPGFTLMCPTSRRIDSPLPPTYISTVPRKGSVVNFDGLVNKRFSKMLEYFNESKETDL